MDSVTDVTQIGLRERKKTRTRLAIERAALELFAERGFAETTVEEIAATCEISPRTFFRYFATKDDALYADSDRRLAALVEEIQLRATWQPPFAAVRDAVLNVIDDYQGDRQSAELHSRVLARNVGAFTRSLERQHVWEEAIFTALTPSGPSQAGADFLELRLVAATATAALRAAVHAWEAANADHPAPLSPLVHHTFDRISTGLER
jgi:AcrR family transcriptional regulator